MLLISLIVLPMYGQEWINFGKMKECTKVPVYFTVTDDPYYRFYKFEGNTVIYIDVYEQLHKPSDKLPEVRVPVVSFSKNGKQPLGMVTIPGTVTVVGTGDEQVITYEFLNINGSYSRHLIDLFAWNEKPVEFWSPVKVTDPFADSEEYGYRHYFSYTSSLQKRISTRSLGWVDDINVTNVRIVIKSKPKDAVGLMAYLGAKLGTKEASPRAGGTYKIPENGKEIACSAENERNNERKDEVTYLHYSAEGSPEEIKSVANFLLKSLKCNTAFAPKKTDDTSSSNTKKYKQFIVSDSLEISISISDYSEYMNFRMGVWKK